MPRQFAQLAFLAPGDRVQCDEGFTCLEANAIIEVRADASRQLYINCGCGRHYLEGQLDDSGFLIGLWPLAAQ